MVCQRLPRGTEDLKTKFWDKGGSSGFSPPAINENLEAFVVEPIDVAVSTLARRSGEMIIALELGFEGRLNVHLLGLATELLLEAEPHIISLSTTGLNRC